MHARRTAVSRALSDTRASERVRSIPLVRVPGESKPQAEERAGRAAHWPDEETAVPITIQTSQALPGLHMQARHAQDQLCSQSRRATSARSSSPATAERTDSRMTCSALCISHVSLNRTVGVEPERACAASLHCVTAVGHVGLFVRLFARSCSDQFLLHPYNEGGAVQLEVAPDERPNAAPGGRAASTSPRRGASRRSHRALQMQVSGVPLCPQARECLSRVNL